MCRSGTTRCATAHGATGRAWRWLVMACALVVGGALVPLAGCGTPSGPLARPVVIGASVSAGVQSLERNQPADGGASGPSVDLARAIDACLTVTHGQTKLLADRAMVFDANGSLQRQVTVAMALKPTVVFAIDSLFWTAYAPADSPADRVRRLDEALASLDRIEVPLVVGNLPDMRGSVAAVLGDRAAVNEIERCSLNERIRAWASLRPRVAFILLDELIREIRAGEPVDLGRAQVEARDVGGLLSSDGLHLTPEGQVALATLALSSLATHRVIPADAIRANPRISRAILREQASRDSGSVGTDLGASTIARTRRGLELVAQTDRAIKDGDVDRAAALIEERFDPARADLRHNADALDVELALSRLPALRDALQPAVERLVRAGRSSDATTEAIVSGIELSLLVGDEAAGRSLAALLAPRVLADQRAGTRPEVPSSSGYAHRLYEWFSTKHHAVAASLFLDADATAQELAELRTSDRAKLAFARKSGVAPAALHLRSPEEEISRFATILRDAGRTDEALRIEAQARAMGAQVADGADPTSAR